VINGSLVRLRIGRIAHINGRNAMAPAIHCTLIESYDCQFSEHRSLVINRRHTSLGLNKVGVGTMALLNAIELVLIFSDRDFGIAEIGALTGCWNIVISNRMNGAFWGETRRDGRLAG
jgi:hypothetical protein